MSPITKLKSHIQAENQENIVSRKLEMMIYLQFGLEYPTFRLHKLNKFIFREYLL